MDQQISGDDSLVIGDDSFVIDAKPPQKKVSDKDKVNTIRQNIRERYPKNSYMTLCALEEFEKIQGKRTTAKQTEVLVRMFLNLDSWPIHAVDCIGAYKAKKGSPLNINEIKYFAKIVVRATERRYRSLIVVRATERKHRSLFTFKVLESMAGLFKTKIVKATPGSLKAFAMIYESAGAATLKTIEAMRGFAEQKAKLGEPKDKVITPGEMRAFATLVENVLAPDIITVITAFAKIKGKKLSVGEITYCASGLGRIGRASYSRYYDSFGKPFFGLVEFCTQQGKIPTPSEMNSLADIAVAMGPIGVSFLSLAEFVAEFVEQKGRSLNTSEFDIFLKGGYGQIEALTGYMKQKGKPLTSPEMDVFQEIDKQFGKYSLSVIKVLTEFCKHSDDTFSVPLLRKYKFAFQEIVEETKDSVNSALLLITQAAKLAKRAFSPTEVSSYGPTLAEVRDAVGRPAASSAFKAIRVFCKHDRRRITPEAVLDYKDCLTKVGFSEIKNLRLYCGARPAKNLTANVVFSLLTSSCEKKKKGLTPERVLAYAPGLEIIYKNTAYISEGRYDPRRFKGVVRSALDTLSRFPDKTNIGLTPEQLDAFAAITTVTKTKYRLAFDDLLDYAKGKSSELLADEIKALGQIIEDHLKSSYFQENFSLRTPISVVCSFAYLKKGQDLNVKEIAYLRNVLKTYGFLMLRSFTFHGNWKLMENRLEELGSELTFLNKVKLFCKLGKIATSSERDSFSEVLNRMKKKPLLKA